MAAPLPADLQRIADALAAYTGEPDETIILALVTDYADRKRRERQALRTVEAAMLRPWPRP